VHLAEDEDEGDAGDEGDMEDFDEGDLELMSKAMAGEGLEGAIEGGFDVDDTAQLTMRIREMSASGELDSEEEDAHPNEMLNQLAEEAAQVPLPDDDVD